jgi:hypothetical protein
MAVGMPLALPGCGGSSDQPELVASNKSTTTDAAKASLQALKAQNKGAKK